MNLWYWWKLWRSGQGAADAPRTPISLAELQKAVDTVEPAARLVPPRLLRRVIRLHARLSGFGFRVPHARSYVIGRDALLEIAEAEELGFRSGERLPETLILLARPSAEELAEEDACEILVEVWQMLFHAEVHRAFAALAPSRKFTSDDAVQRVAALGPQAWDEIRAVLQQERFLLPHADDTAVYVEFAAVYLGLRHFAPHLTPEYFPSLEDLDAVDRLLALDIDAKAILQASRLPGTPSAEEIRAAAVDPLEEETQADAGGSARKQRSMGRLNLPRPRSEKTYRKWWARAVRQAAVGNDAGAAIRRAYAEFWAPRERAAEAATALRDDVHRLVARLQAALEYTHDDPRPWRESLLALAHQAPRGLWTVEARLLYDLQKVCADHERPTFAIDLVEWIVSWGKQPIKRPLPSQREVLMSKHLRSALRRVARVRIAERQRRQLMVVLETAAEHAESRLREHFRPRIDATLAEVGLVPQNLPERVANKKLVEELLDRIVERGFINMGDVRDAISRNNLKEPDCAGPQDFMHGDALLRANRRLGGVLDVVYQRGEIYLRWIQRFSLLAFGTKTGRFITKYLAIPFGGAYVILAALDHFIKLLTGYHPDLVPHGLEPASYRPTLLVGLLLLAVLQMPWFRQGLSTLLHAVGRGLRFVIVDMLLGLLRQPWVQELFASRVVRAVMRYGTKPALLTLVLYPLLPSVVLGWSRTYVAVAIFCASNCIMNSRLGRTAEELLIDGLVESWHRFGMRVIVGLFWWIIDMFRRLLQLIERLLYTVDELLRFRSGQSRVVMVLKGAFGLLWFFVAYLVRFCVNLLIEPQVNPIKHVPVVTVSHKLIAPMSITLLHFLETKMSSKSAGMLTFVIITGTPGIFGFLAWELLANWRLFAANRAKGLRPVPIGQHGETMLRLLKPGFHSGTVPKLFGKLRRAERHALHDNHYAAARRHRAALRHAAEEVRHYLDREFVELFVESPAWQHALPAVGEVRLTTNRIETSIALPGVTAHPLGLAFEMVAGRLEARLEGEMPSVDLSPAAEHVLRTALTGIFTTACVMMVRREGDRGEPIGEKEVAWSEWVESWSRM